MCFKIEKNMFCKYLELSSKMIFNINIRKLPSQYGEVSVMFRNIEYAITHFKMMHLFYVTQDFQVKPDLL